MASQGKSFTWNFFLQNTAGEQNSFSCTWHLNPSLPVSLQLCLHCSACSQQHYPPTPTRSYEEPHLGEVSNRNKEIKPSVQPCLAATCAAANCLKPIIAISFFLPRLKPCCRNTPRSPALPGGEQTAAQPQPQLCHQLIGKTIENRCLKWFPRLFLRVQTFNSACTRLGQDLQSKQSLLAHYWAVYGYSHQSVVWHAQLTARKASPFEQATKVSSAPNTMLCS